MKYIYLFMALISSSTLFAQNINQIIKKHFPSANEPGGIALIKQNNEQTSHSFGLAHITAQKQINDSTHFRMASVSKQITAMAIYQLIRENKLSFDTKISTFFPQLKSETKDISVGQLINHTSGILDYEDLMPNDLKEQLSDADVLALIVPVDSVYFEAGSQFKYSNTAYCLMTLIVEKISGLTYPQFVESKLFKKQGITSARVYTSAMDIRNRAYGYHPVKGEFKFADQSFTSATKGDGGVYISALELSQWADRSNSFYDAQFFSDLETNKSQVSEGVYYSLGWFFSKTSTGNLVLFHSGESTGFRNIVVFEPHQNKLTLTFTNRDDLKIADFFEEINKNTKIKGIEEPLFLWLSKVYSHQLNR